MEVEDSQDRVDSSTDMLSVNQRPKASPLRPGTYDGHTKNARQSIQRQYVYLYRNINMLLNFVALNFTGFDKILKVYDKRAIADCRDQFRKQSLLKRNFVCSVGADELLEQTVHDFAENFENGVRANAEIRLLSKMTKAQYGSKDMFRLGWKTGIVLSLIFFVVYFLCYSLNAHKFALYHSGFYPVYRGIGCALVFAWMWGANIYIWERYRINFVYLLEINPRNRLSYHQMWEEACNLSIVYLVNLTFLLSHVHLVPLHWRTNLQIYPMSLFLYMIYRCFAPYHLASLWESRNWLLNSIYNTIIAPFGRIRFCDSYVADVLTSMVKVLADLAYGICFYSNGGFRHPFLNERDFCHSSTWVFTTVFSTLPLWWRFAQNIRLYYDTSKRWPYGGNSLKYALSQMVVIAGSFHPLYHINIFTTGWYLTRSIWFVTVVVSASYSFYWDIVHDFGLWTNEGWMKRKLLYPHVWWYYAVAIIDFFLRFSWTLTITPMDPLLNTTYMPIIIIAELFRRFLWGIFRMEHEQVKKQSIKLLTKEEAMEKKLHFVPMYFDTKELSEERMRNTQGQSSTFLRETIIMILLLFVTSLLVAIM